MTLIFSTKMAVLCEFKAYLGYIASSRPARDSEKEVDLVFSPLKRLEVRHENFHFWLWYVSLLLVPSHP